MKLELGLHETSTPLWGKLKAHYDEELAKCRSRLEADLTEKDTAHLRTKIAMIKEFLAMGTPSKK